MPKQATGAKQAPHLQSADSSYGTTAATKQPKKQEQDAPAASRCRPHLPSTSASQNLFISKGLEHLQAQKVKSGQICTIEITQEQDEKCKGGSAYRVAVLS